ncbi:hypothetical protein MVEN_01193700 [Mycena venus]|uniref:F-box domain-containing protein n=1 Tax=Mycena venus TaxID=2733690 RepID=A0A8H7CVX3_9AGAR|nr:hypothetical protein MVEN_01193700 [Mycena venus]
MALFTIPPEICAAICVEVDQSGLVLLCQTSRLLLDEAQRILYHSVDLRGRSMDAVRSWTLAVTRHSHLAERVHALALQLPDISTLNTSDSVKIGRALRLCVNLKELRLLGEFAQYQRRVDGIYMWMMSECPFRLHSIEIDSESQSHWNAPFWKNQTEIRVLSMPYCRNLPAFLENQVPQVIALGLLSLRDLPAGRPLQRVETRPQRDFSPLAQYSRTLTTLNLRGEWRHREFSIEETLTAIAASVPSLLHLGLTELNKKEALFNANTPTPVLRRMFPNLKTFVLQVRNIARFLDELWFGPNSYDMASAADIENFGIAIMNACPTLQQAVIGGEVRPGQESTCVLRRLSGGEIHAKAGSAFDLEALSMFWKP